MHRYENILAALGGMPLDGAIAKTRHALSKQLDVSGLELKGSDRSIELTLEEKYAIAKYVRGILEARLSVLENESGDSNQQVWCANEDEAEEATTSRDQPLEKLTDSVGDYDGPFEPVGVEDWAALDPNHLGADPGDIIPDHLVVQKNATMSAAVMRTMPNIASEWGLQGVEMATLLGLKIEAYRAYSHDPSQAALTSEQLERASYVLGIYKSLMILFHIADRQRGWLHHSNRGEPFKGAAPINHLRSGRLEALRELRAYLDAVRRGGFS